MATRVTGRNADFKRLAKIVFASACLMGAAACNHGGGSGGGNPSVSVVELQSLTVGEVEQILSQATQEALARSRPATIAVADRVGNVLAVFRMNGAAATATVDSGRGVITGLGGALVPDTLAAISKAVTAAFLSSRGNAFTTRTASQIVQQNFNPGEIGQPGGPLFGVQFSQLPCSDLNVRFISGSPQAFIGPKRAPLGLSADSGGLPLYKNGDLVGGIGVIADGIYGLDLNILDFDQHVDELIAHAGTTGFTAADAITANRITVDGRSLRFIDSTALVSVPSSAPAFVNGAQGNLVAVRGYVDGPVVAGRAFGAAASGIREDTSGIFGVRAFILVDGNNQPRFSPIAGTDGANALAANEVTAILANALEVAYRARAQIRRPLGSHAQVSVSVVDSNGRILGIVRTPDAPIFGTDVSLQKARSAALFSHPDAGADLIAAGINVLGTTIGDYVVAARGFVGPTALSDGTAYSDRAIGNLARPFYPDGINGNPNGPFSRAFADWSPFSTGLQLDLVVNNIVQHLQFVTDPAAIDTLARCTNLPLVMATGSNRLANGLQIFAGSVSIYRGVILVGGIGVSGDGVDQDDMVAFLGLHNAGIDLGAAVGNAPTNIRADNLMPGGVLLRYVNCPVAPFLDSNDQNVCAGL